MQIRSKCHLILVFIAFNFMGVLRCNYGPQDGDSPVLISDDEQHGQAVEAIVEFTADCKR